MWKYRYYLTQNKKALPKFLQCLNLEYEGKILMELMIKWAPMDVEDALELLGSKYKSYPKIRSYAVSRLMLASNDVIHFIHLLTSYIYLFVFFSNLQIESYLVFVTACASVTL